MKGHSELAALCLFLGALLAIDGRPGWGWLFFFAILLA